MAPEPRCLRFRHHGGSVFTAFGRQPGRFAHGGRDATQPDDVWAHCKLSRKLMSTAGAECVIAPAETNVAPLKA